MIEPIWLAPLREELANEEPDWSTVETIVLKVYTTNSSVAERIMALRYTHQFREHLPSWSNLYDYVYEYGSDDDVKRILTGL